MGREAGRGHLCLSVSSRGCPQDFTPRKSPGPRTGPPDLRGRRSVAGRHGHGAGTQPGSLPPLRPPEAAQAPAAAAAGRGEATQGRWGAGGGDVAPQPSWAWSVGGLAGLTHRELRAENEAQLLAEPWGRPCVTGNQKGGRGEAQGNSQQRSCLRTTQATARGAGAGRGGRGHPTSSLYCPGLRVSGHASHLVLKPESWAHGTGGGPSRGSTAGELPQSLLTQRSGEDRAGPPERALPVPCPRVPALGVPWRRSDSRRVILRPRCPRACCHRWPAPGTAGPALFLACYQHPFTLPR